MDLSKWIRDVPDYPKPGIVFRDLTPLLANPEAFRHTIGRMADHFRPTGLDSIAAIDARGFLFGAPLAVSLGLPLIPLRKAGKLPPETIGADFDLEYGSARIEVRSDALAEGQRVLIVDDLLATGGTAAAAARVVEQLGARVSAFSFVVELSELGGRKALGGADVLALVRY